MNKSLADECLTCMNGLCIKGCPLNNDITEFIKFIKEDRLEDAYKVLSNTTVLMSICGRVCPHSKLCEGSCIKNKLNNPVKIGKLESMIGDLSLEKNWNIDVPKETKYNVAVVGSGPSSLTCAAFLRKNGIGVTIYEKYDYLGGLLVHGIPDFRLDKNLVKKVTDSIINLGIDVKYNTALGKDISLEELKEKHDAVFIGIGANVSNKMNIEGEDLEGVYGANEILEYNENIDYKGKNVVISGGGNVATDIARTVIRKGAKKVTIIYRRSQNEMPADTKEVEDAINDKVEFLYQTNILKILGDINVREIEVIKTELIDKENERPYPVNVEGTNYNISCDIVISAVGSHIASEVNNFKLEKQSNGKIIIDEEGHTSDEKVFSGGDVAGVPSTVSWASFSGRKAAYSIIKYLGGTYDEKVND